MAGIQVAVSDDRICTVTIDRHFARNAVDGPTAAALAEAFLAFDRDDKADVAILTGANGAFCAGADLKAVATGTGSNPLLPPSGSTDDGTGPMGPSRLLLRKPVIAAIAGSAVAGGLELALWCDLRVVEQTAVLGVFCRRWGVPLIDGGTIRLPRLIGHSRALDLILTGRAVGADEALAMGLANRVVPAGQALAAATQLAREIARFPQACLQADRWSSYRQWDLSLAQALAEEFAAGSALVQSGSVSAGAARFAEGRGRGGDFSDI